MKSYVIDRMTVLAATKHAISHVVRIGSLTYIIFSWRRAKGRSLQLLTRLRQFQPAHVIVLTVIGTPVE
jgi:hypothetical protein